MRKQIMYLLLFGWLLTPLSAWADSNVKFLCIQLRDGTTAEFALADHPVITLTGGTMKAETAKKTITASLADIVRYTFKEEGAQPTSAMILKRNPHNRNRYSKKDTSALPICLHAHPSASSPSTVDRCSKRKPAQTDAQI